MRKDAVVSVAMFVALFVRSQVVAQPSFTGLGSLPGGASSGGTGVSADGSVVVGSSGSSDGVHAFRWTSGGGMVDLGTLPGSTGLYALGVSGDGLAAVGYYESANGSRSFRWTSAGGMLNLIGGNFPSQASGISTDGSTIVGYLGSQTADHAFRMAAEDGFQILGALPGGIFSHAFGVSGNGAVVVGLADVAGNGRAFRWTTTSGMTNLGTLGGTNSIALGANWDGSVVVGWGDVGFARAFRWTSSGGMVNLGALPNGGDSEAHAVSGDGSTVVGISGSEIGASAFLWKPSLGMVNLNTCLPVLDGWEATRLIKSNPVTQRIPVIALTAHAMSTDREKAFEAKCDDYDTKPVELSRLLQKIEALLSK